MLKIEKIGKGRIRLKGVLPYRVMRDNDDGTRSIVGEYRTKSEASDALKQMQEGNSDD